MFPTTPDHVTPVLERLLEQFKNAQNFRDLLESIALELDELETELVKYADNSTISTADDFALDAIGDLVGEPRLGRNDADYRAAIRTRIILNTGGGTIENLITVIEQFSDPPIHIHQLQAAIQVETGGNEQSGLTNAIRRAKPAGVELLGVVSASGDRFGYVSSTGTPPDVPSIGGYGSVFDPNAGQPYSGLTAI